MNSWLESMTDDRLMNDALRHAETLVERQQFDLAIEALDALCRVRSEPQAEALLAECRYRAYLADPPRAEWQDPRGTPVQDPFAGIEGIPEIAADELSGDTLVAGIRCHGALLVRGLLPQERAVQLAQGVERALADRETWGACGSTTPWYSRLPLPEESELAGARLWVESAGGVWTADSPRMLRELIDVFKSTGVVDAIAGYFGERPLLSVGKSTLRRVPSTIRLADWHQDGAFMGSDIRSVNLWLSLSHCGEDASGLEFLPRRLSHVLPTGTHGAHFGWSVGPELVAREAAAGAPVAAPRFAPGDAMLFDHFFLHRTGIPAAIAKDRYAVESWFFAPSAYPVQQVPLKL